MNYTHLLYIDDDEDDQEILSTALEQLAPTLRCTCESEATEALKKLCSNEIEPDVIFLDLNMPVMNGQQFLMNIKKLKNLKNIPVIIFSTSSQQQTIQLMLELGAKRFIPKPATFAELFIVLKTVFI